jgi:hypothetical protein
LLSLWGLPFSLVQAVAFADQPSLLGGDTAHPSVTLHIAHLLQQRLAQVPRAPWAEQPGLDRVLLDSGCIDEAWLEAAEVKAEHWSA